MGFLKLCTACLVTEAKKQVEFTVFVTSMHYAQESIGHNFAGTGPHSLAPLVPRLC